MTPDGADGRDAGTPGRLSGPACPTMATRPTEGAALAYLAALEMDLSIERSQTAGEHPVSAETIARATDLEALIEAESALPTADGRPRRPRTVGARPF